MRIVLPFCAWYEAFASSSARCSSWMEPASEKNGTSKVSPQLGHSAGVPLYVPDGLQETS